MIRNLRNVFVMLLFMTTLSAAVAFGQDCSYWESRVGARMGGYNGAAMDEKDPSTILKGIECLLRVEGNKSRGPFSGATHTKVSRSFPQATVEVCALYYISWLFTGDYQHSNAVALSNGEEYNTDEAIKIAFEYYRKWFERVKEIGLAEARRQELDPLDGSGVSWY